MTRTIFGKVMWEGRAQALALGVAVVTALALCLLAWVAVQPAEAAFPGKNGKIAFQSNRHGNNIHTINPTGGTATDLTRSDGNSDPAFSPDGTRIAFVSGGALGYDIFVMNADGGGRRQLTNTGSADMEPTWSPDGTKIAFVSNTFALDGQSDYEIWVMNADGSDQHPITNNSSSETQPAWSPDGSKIAFESRQDIYVMDADGNNQTNITPDSPTGCSSNCYQGLDEDPAWSPDGSKIAYVHGYGPPDNPFAGGGVPNIWTMDANGNNKINVSNNPDTSAIMPTWSPDGSKIAYVGTESGTTNRDIWLMDADGTDQHAIETNAANDINPDWQQDSIPPNTTITSGPASITRSTSASFAFVSSEFGSSFQCSLDNATFSPCSSAKSYTGLTNGLHTFRVLATDAAGNVDLTPAARSWRVDTQRPSGRVVINGGSASTTRRTVTLKLGASDPAPASGVSHMRLKNNGTTSWSGWYAYTTSKSWALSAGAGKKTVYVQYKDRAGNISATAWDTITFRP